MANPYLITLFEHQRWRYEALGLTPEHKAVAALNALNERLAPPDRPGAPIIALGLHELRSTQFVGVVRAGPVTFQVLPKIDWVGNTDAAQGTPEFAQAVTSAQQNLMYMLSYVFDLETKAKDVAGLSSQELDWFELLTRLFAQELHHQVQVGMAHSYVVQEETLPVIRGRWDLARQALKRPGQWFPFETRYDEFSPDTPLNRIFRFVAHRLLWQTRDAVNRQLLLDIDAWLEPVQLVQTVASDMLQQAFFTRLNGRFRPAFNLARLFLSGLTPQLRHGQEQVFAFVFDMNRLFERFVALFLQRHRATVFPQAWQDARLGIQSTLADAYLAQWEDGGHLLHLEPDILFMTPEQNRTFLILDTKYKQLDLTRNNLNIQDGDLYQMLAYSVQFNCPRIVLLYPQSATHPGSTQRQLSLPAAETQIFIRTINLRRKIDVLEKSLMNEFHQMFADFVQDVIQE